MVPVYTEVVTITSDANIAYGDENEHDWDGVAESAFICGSCNRPLLVKGHKISADDPCSLLRWFRELRKEMGEPITAPVFQEI
jgi:hypothetical protein